MLAIVVDIARLCATDIWPRMKSMSMSFTAANSSRCALASSARSNSALARGEAEFGLEFLGPGALAGAELPAIAARRAVAEAVRLDQRDRRAGLGEMRRRRKPGEAAADDRDIASPVAVQRADRPAARRRLPRTRNSRGKWGIGRS